MILRWLWLYLAISLFGGCFLRTDPFLDPSIPRVGTPLAQIATVRTKWINGKLLQTTFLDKQSRVLEDFMYGRTNEKILNNYIGDHLVSSIYYYHSDSADRGSVDVSKSRFEYDKTGRITCVFRETAYMGNLGIEKSTGSFKVNYTYRSSHDTLFNVLPAQESNLSTVADINRWERNKAGQLVRNFRFYVMKMPRELLPDTIEYYSHRFSYDTFGRRKMAWFDLMYLGRFYEAAGPDTIRYFYDNQSRLVREVHQYTIDMKNKIEIDTNRLDRSDFYRKKFFVGDSIFHNNAKTNLVEYRYETFNSSRHLPLQTSHDVDY